ncbi:uncharacterized protein LOC127903662 isoform X3 [Citrus sinensis]|uniref:uncharacterized protein LOC127903662 isoform X3 n=1 Tax=Citrus sinensis TaxID=2711 RepID=UPI002278AB78|nr:uncharacterized protein LOC127903662 isoform X3 [Citrus sinensis]
MVITAHYIDSSWVLRSRIMRFIYVPAPHSAEIARDFLAIPVSTVASESAFSTGGRHLSHHRSRLHPSTVEALVCTQNWFWLEQNLKDGIPEEAILSAEHLIDESLMSEQQSNEVHNSEFSL